MGFLTSRNRITSQRLLNRHTHPEPQNTSLLSPLLTWNARGGALGSVLLRWSLNYAGQSRSSGDRSSPWGSPRSKDGENDVPWHLCSCPASQELRELCRRMSSSSPSHPLCGSFSWNVGLKRWKNIFGTPSKKLLLTLWCLEPWADSDLETDTQKVAPYRALREHLLGTRGKLLAARGPEDRRVLIMASPLLCCLAIQRLTFAREINIYQRF